MAGLRFGEASSGKERITLVSADGNGIGKEPGMAASGARQSLHEAGVFCVLGVDLKSRIA